MRRWIAVTCVLVAVACDQNAEDGAAQECDPLAADPATIELATIVGAGQDAQGTIYVVDRLDYETRVFVGDTMLLVRQRVAGAGGGGDDEFITVADHDPPFALHVQTSASDPRMWVLVDPGQAEGSEIAMLGEALTLVDAAMLVSVPLMNLSGEIEIEYLGQLADDRLLVVTRPRDDWSYEDFRAFFGPPDDVLERSVASVARERDGGSTTIELAIGGDAAIASFPIVSTPAGFEPGPATLAIGDELHELTLLPKMSPTNAVYRCLAP